MAGVRACPTRRACTEFPVCAPALGAAAQAYGPQGVFTVLCAVPVPAVLLGLFLTGPEPSTGD
ncbi:hypothetical protein ACLQ2N_14470 [Streptomyces sp. DT224]|uniref:hypothetical protein n=1 Tax=Streptomyces sp. DT224 TaxID=3393426 RepID=UPI003CF68FF5